MKMSEIIFLFGLKGGKIKFATYAFSIIQLFQLFSLIHKIYI